MSFVRRVLFPQTRRNFDTFQGDCVACSCLESDKVRNCPGAHNSEEYDDEGHYRQKNNESDREIVRHYLLPTAAQRADLGIELEYLHHILDSI